MCGSCFAPIVQCIYVNQLTFGRQAKIALSVLHDMRSRKAIWRLLHMIVFAVVLTSLQQSYLEDGERSLWTWIWSGEWNENQSLIYHLHYKLPHSVCSNGVWKAWMLLTQNVLLGIVSCIVGKLGAPGDSNTFLNASVDSSTDRGRRHCSFQGVDASIVASRISLSVGRSRCSLAQKFPFFNPQRSPCLQIEQKTIFDLRAVLRHVVRQKFTPV